MGGVVVEGGQRGIAMVMSFEIGANTGAGAGASADAGSGAGDGDGAGAGAGADADALESVVSRGTGASTCWSRGQGTALPL